ncbi:LysO family transporter [uncultured Ilyobacter sp.]|uniref:LysO family transporter n=1 Tax=uncultured Ilyobacter sp. TaxID=544433 RepID=UPI0029C7A87D|nr:LysO family transporter [uncultured Ilyobacter sp.]
MRILLYLTIISIGYTLGSKNLFPEKFKHKLLVFQNCCLLFLLGTMGYKIGSNREIVQNIGNIGMKSLIISSFCIFFSVLFVKISCRSIVKEKLKEDSL